MLDTTGLLNGRMARITRALRSAVTTAAAAGAVVALSACDSGSAPTGPDATAVAGSYTATTFTATRGGTTTDVLSTGGRLELTLSPNGTSAGRVYVPAQVSGEGEALDASMDGTWSVRDGTVRLSQPTDTFVRDVPFTVDGSRLRGEATFGGTTVRLILAR